MICVMALVSHSSSDDSALRRNSPALTLPSGRGLISRAFGLWLEGTRTLLAIRVRVLWG